MNNNIKYGLNVAKIESIVSVLKSNKRIAEIILFGSRAKGTHHTGSDIDIALIGDNLKLDDIVQASIEIDKLYLPYKVDLVIFDRIKEQGLIEHIQRVGQKLYSRQNAIPV